MNHVRIFVTLFGFWKLCIDAHDRDATDPVIAAALLLSQKIKALSVEVTPLSK